MCRPPGVYDAEGTSGETLQQLHAFCNVRLAASLTPAGVAYITDSLQDTPAGAINDGRYNAMAVAALTRAVLISVFEPSAACNACGAAFHPLPYPHFVGDMF